MQILVSILLRAIFIISVLYFIIWVWSFKNYSHYLETGSNNIIDTSVDGQKFSFAYRPEPILRTGKKVFIIGSSNTSLGFRPNEIAPFIGGSAVHNISYGGANIEEIRQIIDQIYMTVPKKEKREKITFVLGIWYGTFKTTLSSFNQSRLRYGLYRTTHNGVKPLIPIKLIPRFSVALLPFFLIANFEAEFLKDSITISVRVFHELRKLSIKQIKRLIFLQADPNIKDQQSKTVQKEVPQNKIGDKNNWVVNETTRIDALEQFNTYELKEEQFQFLVNIAALINKMDDRLVIVELPIPRWHKTGSVVFKEYQKTKTSYVKRVVEYPTATYFNFQDLDNGNDFYDGTHPKPKISKKWGRLLATKLNKITSTEKKEFLVNN
jgi:hypothetical protein